MDPALQEGLEEAPPQDGRLEEAVVGNGGNGVVAPPEGEAAPAANVALGPAADLVAEEDAPVIELGDRIRILGGPLDGTTGRVVLRTETELHLMPDGLSNSVKTFEINEEGFDPNLGIEAVEILQKRKKAGLVDILNLRVDQILETFDEDGTPGERYEIVQVMPDTDTVVVRSESGEDLTIPFGFRGVRDLPFRVIRGREKPQKAPAGALAGVPEEGEAEANAMNGAVGEGEAGDVEYEDFEFLDEELEEEPPAADFSEHLYEIPRSEVLYKDYTQKAEAYADLLALETPAMQQLTQVQKRTRVLTEMFYRMRQAILRVSADGIPKGVKPTSIQTLVDALETRLVVISRCVFDVNKRLFHDANAEEGDQAPADQETIRFEYQKGNVDEAAEYLESSPDMDTQKYIPFMNSYTARYTLPWTPSGAGEREAFVRDEEGFRLKAPDAEGMIPGYPRGLSDEKGQLQDGNLAEVSMSLIRGLKAIRAKGQVVQLGEEAAVLAYVLFPLTFAPSLTTASTESFARDIQAGLEGTQSMKDILTAVGGEISEVPVPNQPFLISVEGGSLGNIPLREYLKAAGLRLQGMGDIWPIQVLLGMQEREWTIDQQAVIQESIKSTQDQIIAEIVRQRESLAAIAAQPPATQGIQVTPDGPALIEKLGGEPILKEIQDKLKEEMPTYQNSDVAHVGLIVRKYPELSFAQIADQPAALAKARTQFVRQQYIDALGVRQRLKFRKEFAGAPPEENHCPHVKNLVACRRIKEDNDRMKALSKLLAMFEGEKKDNWSWCNACNKHLMCRHEVLQIYQFLRPGDAGVLNKQIQLDFGGGQFQGFYICRVCGQPISEIELDSHLEFDDEGKPLIGRGELVDKDALQEEEVAKLIGPLGDLEQEDEEEFKGETKKLAYRTAKQLADRLYAPLERHHYITIVDRVNAVIQQIPTRERFIQLKRAQRNKRPDTAISQDYDVYINQALVCAVGVHMLLLIQAHKPNLILRGTPLGCRSLLGQPLEVDGGTHGIQCVISVISSFQKDSAPWNLTQFQTIADDTARQKAITAVFDPILKTAMNDPTIQQALAQKREYLRKTLGMMAAQGRPEEQLPANFAPIPYQLRPEDFVEKIIIPDAASLEDVAELWIRQGNFVAKANKKPMPLAFSETSCCLSELGHLEEFWRRDEIRQSLPPFPPRIGLIRPTKYTKIEPTMKPPQAVRPLPDAPEEAYYQLFLRVCFDGPHKGQSHEFGLTHKCMWCKMQLPAEAEILDAAAATATLEGQGIVIDKESFEDLMDATHRVNRFETKFNTEAPGPLDTWISLMAIEPEPAEGYRAAMAKTQAELAKLPPGAAEEAVALALAEFSMLAGDMEAKLKTRLPVTQHASFDRLIEEGADSIIRFLQSYGIVPAKKFKQGQDPMKVVPPKKWKLSEMHAQDIKGLLEQHTSYLSSFNKIAKTPWLDAKVETFISHARAAIDTLAVLRPIQVPGGDQTYGFLMKFFLFAPLANFVDPNVMPIAAEGDVEVPASQVEEQALFPAKFVNEMMKRFQSEGFRYTPQRIRELIEARNEKEKANILKDLSSKSRAGKEIEMMKMRLGLGRWAHTAKEIYAYNADRYDMEREQRAAAGIVDFPGFGPEGPPPPGGRADDGMAFFGGGGGDGYIGAGDLGNINGFDDDN